MTKLLLTCGCLLFICSVSVSYAANVKPCVFDKTDSKKHTCKTLDKIIPEKLLKIKPLDYLKATERSNQPGTVKAHAPANTFETLITPILKAMSPHFYDQIIKRDSKSTSVQS